MHGADVNKFKSRNKSTNNVWTDSFFLVDNKYDSRVFIPSCRYVSYIMSTHSCTQLVFSTNTLLQAQMLLSIWYSRLLFVHLCKLLSEFSGFCLFWDLIKCAVFFLLLNKRKNIYCVEIQRLVKAGYLYFITQFAKYS